MKKVLCLFLTLLLVAPFSADAISHSATETKAETTEVVLTDGTYAPDQVLVTFNTGAIGESSPNRADLSFSGEKFGSAMDATGDKSRAFAALPDEVDVISESLGKDFKVEETLVFFPEKSANKSVNGKKSILSSALISSEKYDTATMIQKLKINSKIAYAEPNYYVKGEAFDDYSLNDPLNEFSSFLNSHEADNLGGTKVGGQNDCYNGLPAINASSAWKKISGDEEEVVVAIIDTGINYNHKDLKDVMWTNPGNIGLKGKHGYNFLSNTEDILDDNGHGSHCAGIIAAQANNGFGLAGVASKAKVRLMGFKTLDANGSGCTIYAAVSSFLYIHKAVQAGVNVVVTSNSWGAPDRSNTYDEVLEILGNDGVLSVFASGNESTDLDLNFACPASTDNEFVVSVNAIDKSGYLAHFSNYGKVTSHLCAPGVNLLSAYALPNYFPAVYDAETLNATTEYYGEFNETTVAADGTIRPSVGKKAGAGVKSFGDLIFKKRRRSSLDEDYVIPDTATLELSVESDRIFVADNPYRLKVTIRNAQYGEYYYFCFPYEKNPLTKNDNTFFSIVGESEYMEGDETYVYGGDVSIAENEKPYIFNGGIFFATTSEYFDGYVINGTNMEYTDLMAPFDDEESKDWLHGIGCVVSTYYWEKGKCQDVTFYIDSLGLSLPDAELSADDSYEIMSGTSMACPVVGGAATLLAALYPKKAGQSGADYVRSLRARLFSMVRRTDELKDCCSTGGYLDLSLIDENLPAISHAVCDVDENTLTLYGVNLSSDNAVTMRRLAVKDSPYVSLPQETTLEYSADGTSLVIRNARSLFSTLTEFLMTTPSGFNCSGKFFLVNGQKRLEEIYVLDDCFTHDSVIPYLVTNADHTKLFGYFGYEQTVYRYDGTWFSEIPKSSLSYAMMSYIEKRDGTLYSAFYDYDFLVYTNDVPVCMDGMIYTVVYAERYNQLAPPNDEENGEEQKDNDHEYFLASFDLDSDDLTWKIEPMEDFPKALTYSDAFNFRLASYDGHLYFFGDDGSDEATDESLPFYRYDLDAKAWEKMPDIPYLSFNFDVAEHNGKLFVMFGFDPDDSLDTADRLLGGVYAFDGEKWEKLNDLYYVGRINENDEGVPFHSDAFTSVEEGLLFVNASVDGGGNMFVYDTVNDEIVPLFYSQWNSIADAFDETHSVAVTTEGIYYLTYVSDESFHTVHFYFIPAKCGKVTLNGVVLTLPGEPNHVYVENPLPEYLKSPATYDSPAIYYVSCADCGEKGEQTFEYGEKLAPENEDSASSTVKMTIGCHGSLDVGSIALVLAALPTAAFILRKRKD